MEEKVSNNRAERRSILKKIGVSATALTVPVGAVSADKETKNGSNSGPAIASMTVDPSTPGLTDEERSQFMEDMEKKHGERTTAEIIPDSSGISTNSQQPGVEPGIIIWDSTEHIEKTNFNGTTIVESDNYAALYETNVYRRGGGEQYYFYWLWSSARSGSGFGWTGSISEFYNHINLLNDGDITVYDPSSDITRNGTEVTVSANVSGEDPTGSIGASAGIEGTFYLNQDVVRPHPDKTGQNIDEFAVQWKGDYQGTQGINGTCVERRRTDDFMDFEWSVYINGHMF